MIQRFIHFSFLTACISTSFLGASDTQLTEQPLDTVEQCEAIEHVEQGTRTLTASETKSLKKELQAQKKLLDKQRRDKKSTQLSSKCFSPAGFSVYPGMVMHSINDISNGGENIEIENGAVFAVRDWDQSTTNLWKLTDKIQIRPNKDWFSKSNYMLRIYNMNQDSSVAVKLSLGPILKNPYTRFIMAIDTYSRAVFLDNGTRWKVHDSQTFSKWQENDAIIIGENTVDGWFNWFQAEDPCILINVNTNSYLTASPF